MDFLCVSFFVRISYYLLYNSLLLPVRNLKWNPKTSLHKYDQLSSPFIVLHGKLDKRVYNLSASAVHPSIFSTCITCARMSGQDNCHCSRVALGKSGRRRWEGRPGTFYYYDECRACQQTCDNVHTTLKCCATSHFSQFLSLNKRKLKDCLIHTFFMNSNLLNPQKI